jgi:hypothetical protein
MATRAKRPKLSGSSDDRDILRQLLHTGTVSMTGLKEIVGVIKASGLSLEQQLMSTHQLHEANNERLPM